MELASKMSWSAGEASGNRYPSASKMCLRRHNDLQGHFLGLASAKSCPMASVIQKDIVEVEQHQDEACPHAVSELGHS